MSTEHTSTAQGRVRTRDRRGLAPSRGHGSRPVYPAAGDAAQPHRAHTGIGGAGAKALLALAVLALLALALLRTGALHASAVGTGTQSRYAVSPMTQTIDPRLILVPRTITQAATATGVRMALTAGPLLPGPNHFELRLAASGRPIAGARVLLVARMIGMAMRPVTLPMREVQPGRYAALGSLTMFGSWQVTVQIDRPGTAPVGHQFTLSMDLPRGLLTAPQARDDSRR